MSGSPLPHQHRVLTWTVWTENVGLEAISRWDFIHSQMGSFFSLSLSSFLLPDKSTELVGDEEKTGL